MYINHRSKKNDKYKQIIRRNKINTKNPKLKKLLYSGINTIQEYLQGYIKFEVGYFLLCNLPRIAKPWKILSKNVRQNMPQLLLSACRTTSARGNLTALNMSCFNTRLVRLKYLFCCKINRRMALRGIISHFLLHDSSSVLRERERVVNINDWCLQVNLERNSVFLNNA